LQEQRPQEDLIYADVTVASKHKKKTTNTKMKPSVTAAIIQPDLTVEYSAINYNLCNNKVSDMKEYSNNGMQYQLYARNIPKPQGVHYNKSLQP
jgi:hypothetical protein